jgi:glycosidase
LGYNPSFYFAPDKYYGPLNDLKKFIDECHGRGIAVILDMVLNHSFGQSPLVRLYANEQGWPSSENPWYNADYDPSFDGYQARHPWNVGYDFNHNSLETRKLVDRVNNYWLETYRIDGFRFDLAKGLTQDGSHYHGGGNYSDNSDYDLGRVAILERMADKIWETDSTAYVILEHFTANDEEVDLSEYKKGMMLWGNLNYNYNEATMGYNENGKSDFSWGYYKKRLWKKPHLVTFMESHDEERLMFKNLTFGNSSGTYDIKMLEIALNRIKMAASFFFTYPGPKMFWQFGELGYDISIDDPCRVCDKPVLWNYYQEDFRNRLYKTFAALIKLRRSVPAFSSADATVDLSVSSATKRIRIGHSSMNVIIIGNFDVVDREIDPGFYYGGTWYDYFSGNPINVTDTNAEIPLEPGEFHIYTDKKLPTPEYDIINDILDKVPINGSYFLDQNYPNPFNPTTTINFEVAESSHVSVKVFDIIGREIIELVNEKKGPGSYKIKWNGKDSSGISVSSGVFIYEIKATSGGKMVFHQSRKMVLIR